MNFLNMATRKKVLAGAVLLCMGMGVATGVMATDTFGGGATLPAGAYVGFNFLTGTNTRLSANTTPNTHSAGQSGVDAGSLFGAWAASTGNKISYCQTGSGNGKKIFDNTDGTVHLTSVGNCDGTTLGFGAPTGLAVDPHFAGSDAPMSSAEYTNFNLAIGGKAATFGEPSQFPAVVGSIALVFNNSDVAAGTTINLTDSQICGIFSHTITNWNQLGLGLPSRPINVVYRSDGSGTSFSFANHLTVQAVGTTPAVCPASTSTQHFVTDQNFYVPATATAAASGVLSLFFPQAVGGPVTLPASFVGVSGNPAIVTQVASSNGSIGYAEAANAKASASANLRFATVNGRDPIKDLPNSYTFALLNNQVITGANAAFGTPTVAPQTPIIAGTTCLKIVTPASYANLVGTSTAPQYPIIAVSNLIANFKGNGSSTAAVQTMINSVYGTSHPGVTTVGNDGFGVAGHGTGFAFVVPNAATPPNVSSCVTM